MSSQLNNIYESGRTLRYHSKPSMSLLNQTVADHSWGMLAMLFYLHPAPSISLIGAITFHDSPERWVGDLPHPFKQLVPELAEQHNHIGEIFRHQKGIPRFEITEKDFKWLKLLDRLESYQFAKVYDRLDESWDVYRVQLMEAADELGVLGKLGDLFDD